MPDFTTLPARPSLEQLRKLAKERLKVLRSQGLDATLADVQFAIAREHGFQTWAELARHVEAINHPGLRKFEEMAAELAAAYSSADVEAIRGFNWIHGTSFVWHREPEAKYRQLPTWFASETRSQDLAVADARRLVARKSGFDTWDDLVRGMSAARPSSPGAPPATRFYRIEPDRLVCG